MIGLPLYLSGEMNPKQLTTPLTAEMESIRHATHAVLSAAGTAAARCFCSRLDQTRGFCHRSSSLSHSRRHLAYVYTADAWPVSGKRRRPTQLSCEWAHLAGLSLALPTDRPIGPSRQFHLRLPTVKSGFQPTQRMYGT